MRVETNEKLKKRNFNVKVIRKPMVALRVVAKIRRIVLFGLIWTLVIVTLIQWQQKKLKKKSNRLRFDVAGEESESSSGEYFPGLENDSLSVN